MVKGGKAPDSCMDRIPLPAEVEADLMAGVEEELRVVHRQIDACSQEEVELVLVEEQPLELLR